MQAKMYVPTSMDPPFKRLRARSSFDPPTQKTKVYDAVDGAQSGITAYDIATKAGVALDRVRFYLSELRRGGYIAVLGDPTTVSPTMSAREAAFAAMLGLENALVAKAKEGTITAEMEKSFAKYNAIKERALRPGTIPEGQVAIRMALIELIKAVY